MSGSKKVAPQFVLVGDTPRVYSVWPDGPFEWQFDEDDRIQPPGVKMERINPFDLWVLDVGKQRHFVETGDVIVYGANHEPVEVRLKPRR